MTNESDTVNLAEKICIKLILQVNLSCQIDVSQYDFPHTIWFVIPKEQMTIKLVTMVPLVLFGIIGNSLLLNIIGRNRALQTPTNLLLGNMVAADLATLLFCPLMFLCRDFFQNYILGAWGCNLEGYLQGNSMSL